MEVVDPPPFERVTTLKKNKEDLLDLLRHDLAPFPLALFDKRWKRKTKNPSLYDIFPKHENKETLW